MRRVDETRLQLIFVCDELGLSHDELAGRLELAVDQLQAAIGGEPRALLAIPQSRLDWLYHHARRGGL